MRGMLFVVGVVILANLMLLVSGNRLLIGESIVQPGENVTVGQWGNLGQNAAASIVCTYWTGRNTVPTVWWYGGGFMSKDSCPFLHKSG